MSKNVIIKRLSQINDPRNYESNIQCFHINVRTISKCINTTFNSYIICYNERAFTVMNAIV